MHIIITRPKEDSFFLIERLKKLGHIVTHLPVIKIEELKTKKINFQNYKAVIFTSSNAIKFLNVDKFDPKIKCYCVGKTTEFAARQAGFINTFSSEGTVDSLIACAALYETLFNKRTIGERDEETATSILIDTL